MNLMEKMRNYVASCFEGPKNAVDLAHVGLVDVYMERALQILYWQSAERTLRAFFLLNTLFWIILMINLRFYGVISLICLISFVFDIWWRESLYTEYNGEYSGIIKDLKNASRKIIDIFFGLRRESPIVFCLLMILLLLTLHMISKKVPGELLVYMLFLTTFFLPIAFQLLPEHVSSKIRAAFKTLQAPKCVLAEDELIPFIQDKDFNKRDADLESLLTDRTADSVTNSLVSGITSMPSYLEVAETPNDIQEEDLIPRTSKAALTPGELSSDSDSDNNREIKFDSDHFNTSSSDDDPYSKDLAFPKSIQVTPRENNDSVGMFQSMINTVSNNLVVNMFQSAVYSRAPAAPKTMGSESDSSDFEIVDPDEIAGDFDKED